MESVTPFPLFYFIWPARTQAAVEGATTVSFRPRLAKRAREPVASAATLSDLQLAPRAVQELSM